MGIIRREHAGNATKTTLTAGINGSVLAIPIADSTGWPTGATGPFIATIARGTGLEEKVLVQSRSGLNLTVATGARGYDGTGAVAHLSGVTIEHTIAAVEVDELNIALATPGPVSGLSLSTVGDGIGVTFTRPTTAWVTGYEILITDGTATRHEFIWDADFAAGPITYVSKNFYGVGALGVTVYALNGMVRSSAVSGSYTPAITAADVTNLVIQPGDGFFLISFTKPDSRLLLGVDIKKDAQAVAANLNVLNAVAIGSTPDSNFVYTVPTGDMTKYHQFWVTSVLRTF